jgi:hypothetical protein
MVASTLDYFSRVDVPYGILNDPLSFCVVICAYFPRGHTYQVWNTTYLCFPYNPEDHK